MKLSEYLYKKVTEDHEEYVKPPATWPITEEDIEDWLVEWWHDFRGTSSWPDCGDEYEIK